MLESNVIHTLLGIDTSSTDTYHAMDKRTDRQEKILDRQLEWIRASDSKVPPFAILNAAMLAAIATLAPPIECWPSLWIVVGAVYILALVCSLLSLIYSISPRMGGAKESVIYFGGIGRMSARSYRRSIRRISDESYLSDLIEQCYRNAKIARTKFRSVRVATIAVIISIAPWASMVFWFLTANNCAEF